MARWHRGLGIRPGNANSLTARESLNHARFGPIVPAFHSLWIKCAAVDAPVDEMPIVHHHGLAWPGGRVTLPLIPMLSTDWSTASLTGSATCPAAHPAHPR